MTASVCPSWCRQGHDGWDVHDVQVGADLELAQDSSFSVSLLQAGDAPAQVVLYRHTEDVTIATSLSVLEAAVLRDLLSEGLSQLAAEVGR